MRRSAILIFTFGLTAGLVAAPSRNAFIQPSFLNGVVVSKLSEDSFDLQLQTGASVTDASGTYSILDLFGVYRISNGDTYQATGSDKNGWKFDSNFTGPGGVAGWSIKPPQNGLQPGDAKLNFAFNTVTGAGDGYGIHVRLSNGYTKFYEVPGAVPEPATMTAFAGALAILARRRRRK